MKRTIITFAAFGVLAVGCDGTDPTTPATEAVSGPSFNFSNGPSNPGPVVVRTETGFVFGGYDPDNNLIAWNGLGTDDPANSVFCTGNGDVDIMSIQDISSSGAMNQLVQGRNVTQHVYDADTYGGASFCEALSSPRLAEGRGNFRLNDHGACAEGQKSYSFGWRAQGRLTDPATGERVHYNETQRYVANNIEEEADCDAGKWVTEKINLK